MTTLELTSNPADARQIDRLARWTRVLCVLFFFSGFPALIYQLTWQRALFRIFGVNIESVTIVVTAFMLGLGLGSLAGGWLSKRRGIPLLPLLGGIELMTGAFGLLSLKIFDRVSAFTIGLPLPATAAVSLALVIVPTLLMGATLPILVGHLVRRSGHVGSALGLLQRHCRRARFYRPQLRCRNERRHRLCLRRPGRLLLTALQQVQRRSGAAGQR